MIFFKDLLWLIYPALCPVCGRSLFKTEKVICLRCYHHLARTRFNTDEKNPAAQIFWGRVPLQKVIVGFLYNKGNALQKLIHAFKYRGQKNIGLFLGLMGGAINQIYVLFQQFLTWKLHAFLVAWYLRL